MSQQNEKAILKSVYYYVEQPSTAVWLPCRQEIFVNKQGICPIEVITKKTYQAYQTKDGALDAIKIWKKVDKKEGHVPS